MNFDTVDITAKIKKKYKIYEFMGTCSCSSISKIAEKKGRKFSYKKAVKMIHEFDESMYYALALDYRNPYSHQTNIKVKDLILHVVHSQIDYLFKLE